MWRFIAKYWATVAGFSMVAGCVVVGVTVVGADAVESLIDKSLERRGQRFAELLGSLPDASTAMLIGVSRNPDNEADIRRLASLVGVDSFAVFSRNGVETLRSRSDQHEWLLRDRAGGVSTHARLAPEVLKRTTPFTLVQDTPEGNTTVLTSLMRDNRPIGFVSVAFDPTTENAGDVGILMKATGKLLLVLFVAAGVPLLVYIRRKHRIAEASARIDFLANHDPLTRLLNRRRMQEEVDRVITTARATREELIYCCIDIEGLTEINDTLGQAHGDELLQVVANRLQSVVARGDLLSRIAADDFALLVRRAEGPEALKTLAARMRAAVEEPTELKNTIVRPRVAIGVARMPAHGRTQSELVRHAQFALGRHKETRAGDYVEFDRSMDDETERRRHIETLVKNAVETNGFELAYQPLIDTRTKTLVGFEALLRLKDEKHGHVSPAVFVPIAEARGYIKDIGTWVIREAARQAAEWPDHVTVSINLSAVQFRDGDLVRIVVDALADAGIEGRRLEVEVVESLILDRTDSVLGQLQELKQLGVSIAMDDFGTGYSSLGYLWKFPFDKLKIDRSFMLAFEQGEANIREILSAIMSLAHVMHMHVTTEGIETQAQVELMDSLGCDILQGFYFGKPMAPGDAAAKILGGFAERVTRPALTLEAAAPSEASRNIGAVAP